MMTPKRVVPVDRNVKPEGEVGTALRASLRQYIMVDWICSLTPVAYAESCAKAGVPFMFGDGPGTPELKPGDIIEFRDLARAQVIRELSPAEFEAIQHKRGLRELHPGFPILEIRLD